MLWVSREREVNTIYKRNLAPLLVDERNGPSTLARVEQRLISGGLTAAQAADVCGGAAVTRRQRTRTHTRHLYRPFRCTKNGHLIN